MLCKSNVNYIFFLIQKSALECTQLGYGTSVIIGGAPANSEITFDPYLLFTGRTWKGCIFGGIKAAFCNTCIVMKNTVFVLLCRTFFFFFKQIVY